MLLQTNTYIVSCEKRVEHVRLMRRFRQTLIRLGCEQFEVYEQTGSGFSSFKSSGRFVQFMRFRDRKHYQVIQEAERNDADAQELIREFCQLINLEHQKSNSLFAVGFYSGILTTSAAAEMVAPDEAGEELAGSDRSSPGVESRDFTTVDLDAAAQQQAAGQFQARSAGNDVAPAKPVDGEKPQSS
jgi:hypothetical protein